MVTYLVCRLAGYPASGQREHTSQKNWVPKMPLGPDTSMAQALSLLPPRGDRVAAVAPGFRGVEGKAVPSLL